MWADNNDLEYEKKQFDSLCEQLEKDKQESGDNKATITIADTAKQTDNRTKEIWIAASWDCEICLCDDGTWFWHGDQTKLFQ
jgi:hypothetical protein